MKVFLAGATGVLGRPAVRELVAAGHTVRGVARGARKAALLRRLGAEPVSLDLFDAVAVREAVAGSDALIDLATRIPPLLKTRWRGAWAENDRLRREGAHNLVDAAIAARCSVFVMESIAFAYVERGDEWLDEQTPLSNVWAAWDSIRDAEQETERFSAAGGRGVVLRFGALYGPAAGSTLDTIRLARLHLLPIFGNGSSYFPSCHTDDAARAIVAALTAPAGVYNVCDEPVSASDYARSLAIAFKLPNPSRLPLWLAGPLLGPNAALLTRSQRATNARFRQATGWSPRYPSVREGWPAVAAALASRRRGRATPA